MVPYKFLKLCGVFVQIVPKTLDNYPKVTVLNERSRIIRCTQVPTMVGNCIGVWALKLNRLYASPYGEDGHQRHHGVQA